MKLLLSGWHSRQIVLGSAVTTCLCLLSLSLAPNWNPAYASTLSDSLSAVLGSWSTPVKLPGPCGSSVAVNNAGLTAAGGTFTAADGTKHVEVCTSPDGKTWQATDLGQGGDQPNGGQHPAVTVTSNGQLVAVWGSTVGCPAACDYITQAAVRRPSGTWGAPVTLSKFLAFGNGGVVIGADGSGDAIAAWVESVPPEAHYSVLSSSGSWGPDIVLSTESTQGPAHDLSLAVSPDGAAIVAFNGGLNNIWAASGTLAGGFSAPVEIALGYGTSNYRLSGLSEVALDDAGQASIVWSVTGHTGAATRSSAGAWSVPTILAAQSSTSVSTAIDGAGNAIAVFGSSFTWKLAGGTWGTPGPLPAGSTGGLTVADPIGTFVYADTTRNAFTFSAGATSFGVGTGSHGSLADLKIVPGQAVLLADDAVSVEAVN